MLTRIGIILFIWSIFSFTCSGVKVFRGNCGKEYLIDYIFMTNAFCERNPNGVKN